MATKSIALNKYKPKSSEIEAIQLTTNTLDTITRQIQSYAKTDITFEVVLTRSGSTKASKFHDVTLSFVFDGAGYYVYTDDYVIFGEHDFDVMGDAEFESKFEAVPEPVKLKTPSPAIPYPSNPFQTPPFTPYQPRTGEPTWNEVIVKD